MTDQTRPYPAAAAPWRRFLAFALALAALVAVVQPDALQAQPSEDDESPAASPEETRGESPAAWSREEYRSLRAASAEEYDHAPRLTPGERLDRVEGRAGGTGSTDLLQLLGVPRRDVIEETSQKALDLDAGRQKSTKKGAGPALGQGFGFAGSAQELEEKAAKVGPDSEFRVVSSDYLEVDVEGRKIFGTKRSRVTVGRYELEADRMVIDANLRVAQAHGDVVLRDLEGETELTAEWLSFSFKDFSGQAGGVNGEQAGLYFVHDDLNPEPNYLQSNEREIVLRNTGVTGNDFTVPTYQIRGKEIVFFRDERFYILHAVVYVRGWPVAYLPTYTRSLNETSSWQFYYGRDKDRTHELGAFATLRYDYYYKYYEPDPLDDGEYLRRSFARWSPTLYYFQSAQGIGLDANYDYEYGKHKGRTFLFRTNQDDERSLEGGVARTEVPIVESTGQPLFLAPPADDTEEDDGERYAYDIKHRSEILPDVDLLLDVDWVSDSEVYYNYFDKFEEEERGRLFERSAEASVTWRQDYFLARALVSEKERITRNRLSVFFEPGDDDADFDENPDNNQSFFLGQIEPFEEEPDIEGLDFVVDQEPLQDGERAINNRRFRTVSRKEPELNVTTNRIKLSTLPLYWTLDARAFRSLDRGLNAFREEDDTQVEGFDLYNSLSFAWKLGDHFTWHHQFGVGFGRAEREDDTWLVFERDGLNTPVTVAGEPVPLTFPATLNNIVFLDESTFLVGRDPVSIADADENFVYYDYNGEIVKRFNREWQANLVYVYRDGTEDSLFETYERIGFKNARSDIFNYRPRIHRVSGGVNYNSEWPRVTADISGGTNLQGEEDIHANEIREFATANAQWTTLDEEFSLSGTVSWTNTQIRDPSDPFAFEQAGVVYLAQADYFPSHGLWWAQIDGSYVETLDKDPLGEMTRAELEADPELGNTLPEEDDGKNYLVNSVFGFKAGHKWEVELQSRYDDDKGDFDELSLIFLRDLYDAILLVELQWDLKLKEEFENELDDPNIEEMEEPVPEEDRFEREFQVNFGFSFQLPNSERFIGSNASQSVNLRRRPSEFELGG